MKYSGNDEIDNINRSDVQKSYFVEWKIVAIYAVFGILWIYFSDSLLAFLIKDVEIINRIQTYKGILYVLATSALLYFLMRRWIGEIRYWVKTYMENYEELQASYEELTAMQDELQDQYVQIKENEKKIRDSERKYKMAIEGANDSIWNWKIGVSNEYYFDRTKKMLGYDETDIPNRISEFQKLIHKDDRKKVSKALNRHISGMDEYYNVEYRIRSKSGEYLWLQSRGKAIFDRRKKPLEMIGSHRNITAMKKAQDKINYMAYHDYLTGLSSITAFKDDFASAIQNCKEDEKIGFIYIDLDNFKRVNDTLGHVAGDRFLKDIALFLKEGMPENACISRMGGDEFLIFIEKVRYKYEISIFMEELIERFQRIWSIEGRNFKITISAGISMYPNDAKNYENLLKMADTAMYFVKEKTKNNYSFYDESMNEEILESLEMEDLIREGIKNREFYLVYQPKVDLHTGRIKGLEALIRWNNASKGFIRPDQFIPIAEKTNLIVPIGNFVLRTACEQSRKWEQMGYDDTSISVNLSVAEFKDLNIVKNIKKVINDTGLNPRNLELEITESIAFENFEHANEILKELRKMGVKVSLDDFGKGYSSLNYIKELQIDTLKIDKSFVDLIGDADTNEKYISKAVIEMAISMGISVVAEGVETIEQASFLKENNCPVAQGYLFSKPVEASEIEKMLKDGSVIFNVSDLDAK